MPGAAAEEPPAASARVALRWSAPAGCPPATRVVAEVDRILGEAGAYPPAPLAVSAAVSADPTGGLRVRLEATGEGGPRVRELQAASCDALADATALILALMIDPTAVPPAPSPSPAPSPAPPSAPTGRAPSLSPRFHLLAWALADAGSIPGVSFAAGGTAALSLGALRLELGAGAWPGRTAVVNQRPTAGGDVSLVVGSAGACWDLLAQSAFDLAPCAAVEIGRLHASGFGVSAPGEGNALWSAARIGGLFAWAPVTRVALVLRLEAAVPFARPSFVLEKVGPVFRPGPVAGRAGGGVELRF